MADATGKKLQKSMIWTGEPQQKPGVAIAFRTSFELATKPAQATFSLFADARYVLWINGEYVERGPSRFQPNGPEYDELEVARHLRAGRNCAVVLVVGNLSGGKLMNHRPGLTALLEAGGQEVLRTGPTWKWSDATRFRAVQASWPAFGEVLVDTRMEDGDWTAPNYADANWKTCTGIESRSWGPLKRRSIALLREREIPVELSEGLKLPVTLQAGQKLGFKTKRMVQAYLEFEFEAQGDSELSINPFGVQYLARPGKQRHFTLDTRGLTGGDLVIKTGSVTITGLKLVERLYPFDRVGSFSCNDEFLNKLWAMCARSVELLSEDAYVDCADRERVEWMDCDPPVWDMTRVAMAAPGANGKSVFSDPRLLGAMIRRTALTVQPEGWVKAHTCSDRYDIHAKMEDRCAEWVAGIRRYYEATGDAALVREIWPAVAAQMEFFLSRRTPRGLVRARDWVVWGNPVGYLVGEGTTLNVFVQRALVDAAILAKATGETAAAAAYGKAADDLAAAINTVLWDEASGSYFSGYFSDEDVAENESAKRKLSLPRTGNLTPSTLHSTVFALDRGVVPLERRSRVLAKMIEQQGKLKSGPVMIYHYVARLLYGLDKSEYDRRVLSLWRDNWGPMVAAPTECSWESLDAGGSSAAHIYGLFPGAHLSNYVLGVRRDEPVAAATLVIEPHLGDLTRAEGQVITEFGPVPVSWQKEGDHTNFQITVPANIQARLALPVQADRAEAMLDGKPLKGSIHGTRRILPLRAGVHRGSF